MWATVFYCRRPEGKRSASPRNLLFFKLIDLDAHLDKGSVDFPDELYNFAKRSSGVSAPFMQVSMIFPLCQ